MKKELLNDCGQNLEAFLRDYQTHQLNKYKKPSVTVDTLVFTVREQEARNYRKLARKELYLLLIRRKDHPCLGEWALPGGFIDMNENLDESAMRELKEETNLEDIYLEQLYTFGNKNRDPRTRIISVSYLALIPEEHKSQITAGDDAAEALWFKVGYKLDHQKVVEGDSGDRQIHQVYRLQLASLNGEVSLSADITLLHLLDKQGINQKVCVKNSEGLAFDHAEVIAYGLERIKNKLEYTDIIFNLMPKQFTLSELQQVYELLLGEKVYAAQFRRKMEPKLLKSASGVMEAKGHRPAQLFEYNPLWQLNKQSYE